MRALYECIMQTQSYLQFSRLRCRICFHDGLKLLEYFFFFQKARQLNFLPLRDTGPWLVTATQLRQAFLQLRKNCTAKQTAAGDNTGLTAQSTFGINKTFTTK